MPDATHHHHHLDFDSPEMAARAELEGEVLAGLVTDATATLAELCRRHGVEVRRILDLGCGPGVGTCVLAERFGAATVVAADGSATMLAHARARAERLGLADRVETRLVELPGGLATLGRADVAWASMALHHVGDEVDALRGIRDLLAPGGLLALVEHAGPVRILGEDPDLGRPGLWERLDAAWAAWFAGMRATLPGATESAGYPEMLQAAGFDVAADAMLTLAVDPPLDDQGRRFAHGQVSRAREHLQPYAALADLAALEGLLDEPEARIEVSRHLYVARAT